MVFHVAGRLLGDGDAMEAGDEVQRKVDPGGDAETIPAGGQIAQTTPSMSLEALIGQYLFGLGGQKKEGSGEAPPAK